MNIYYFCPDLAQPSGGVKRLYQHVDNLRNEGYPAYILHFKSGFEINWFKSDVPIKYLNENIQWNPTDVLVFPEGLPALIKKFKETPFRKVVIALSHSYIFPNLPLGENWADYGVEAVITPSKVISNFIYQSMGIKNIYLFKTSIDHKIFNTINENKILHIAFVPRKDNTPEIIEKIINAKNEIDIKFVKIENKSINDYARLLRESSIFLATSAHEGIHRSVIEAMACGCICVGYDGIGAKEYIVPDGENQNFVLAENMNYIELTQKLEETIKQINEGNPQISIIKNNAVETAAQFSQEIEKESILKFWKKFL